jgi:outer membrane protein assembly factor BamB/tRNA A-37 threonylcarbamoyl transferase component Bud32
LPAVARDYITAARAQQVDPKETLRQSVNYAIIVKDLYQALQPASVCRTTDAMSLETRQIQPQKPASVGGVDGALAPGRVLQERYEIMGILGLGGMSAVYQARDRRFPNVVKLCAVKEMKSHSLDQQMRQIAIQNFEREANILATLSHPAIPKVYDYFSEEARSYLVMEFIEGRDLEAVLGEMTGFLPQEQVLEWAIQLCDVLQFLHDHNPPIIFRDMKPSNVMLDKHGRLRLIDFGIAKNFQPGQKGTMIGTEGYSPPEQYRGIADQRTDIYALGATLHHVLTRQDPRVEPPFSFHERPIQITNPAVPSEFAQVIMRALEYEPDRRWPSAEEMKRALSTLRPSAVTHYGARATSQIDSGDIQPLWTFACEDEIRSAPAMGSGVLYVCAYDHNLYALNHTTGKFLWKYATDGGIAGSPCVADDRVIVGSDDRVVYCINAQTGRIAWTCPTQGRVRSSPRVQYGHAFFGSDDRRLYAVNVQSGRVSWKVELDGPVRSSVALGDDLLYFGDEAGSLSCVDIRGTLKWRCATKRAVTSSPAYDKELQLVVVGSQDGIVYGLDAQSGWVVWRFRTGKAVISSPCIDNGVVYIGSADTNVYAIEAKTGRQIWKYATDGQVNSSPAVANDCLYVGSVDGMVYSLDTKLGTLRWRTLTGGPVISSPIIEDDVVYVGSNDRLVYALPA